jgi:replicative DNA helicase
LNTGYKDLDNFLGDLLPGEITLIGGRVGMGKTAFALNIVERLAEQNKRILYFPVDNSTIMILRKLICMISLKL